MIRFYCDRCLKEFPSAELRKVDIALNNGLGRNDVSDEFHLCPCCIALLRKFLEPNVP